MNKLKKNKKHNGWFCKECGYESITYLGKCPSCNAWASLIEQPTPDISSSTLSFLPIEEGNKNIIRKLSEIDISNQENRIDTGYDELNRVLGGGIQQGCFILIGGDPGVGKSTLLLQVAGRLCKKNKKILYVSAEESKEQVKDRSLRLEISQDLLFLAETNLENIIEQLSLYKPDLIIIDSIQAISTNQTDAFSASPSQIKLCTAILMTLAKKYNIAIIIVGHITKEGVLAGPKLLEHMVDVVLYFEGERQSYLRIIRSIKNRFGPTDEIGLFEMQESGLKEIINPSSLFMSPEDSSIKTGTCITATLQGSRILLAEIQALTGYTNYPQPKRMVNGLDYNRSNQVIAVLERRIGLALSKHDIYLSAVGGLNVSEPSADLALCIALTSCLRNISTRNKLIVFGEVSLTGEIRQVSKAESRIREAERLGFKSVILPKLNYQENFKNKFKIEIFPVAKLSEALKIAFTE